MSETNQPLFHVSGMVESNYGVRIQTTEEIRTVEDAQAEADRLNMMWVALGGTVERDHVQLSRFKSGGFWAVPDPELHGLTPTEVISGVPSSKRRAEQITGLQTRILAEPFQRRFARIVALIEAQDRDDGPSYARPVSEVNSEKQAEINELVGPTVFPSRKFIYVFSHETMGDERIGDRLEVAFAEYRAAMSISDEAAMRHQESPVPFYWEEFTASNGVRIQARVAVTEFP